ncbi:MAG: hypothetical protein QM733_03595 [Ilumatobacteraceae bacterium]
MSLMRRLHPDAAAAGELAGTAEVIDPGEIVAVRNAHDLQHLVRTLAAATSDAATT